MKNFFREVFDTSKLVDSEGRVGVFVVKVSNSRSKDFFFSIHAVRIGENTAITFIEKASLNDYLDFLKTYEHEYTDRGEETEMDYFSGEDYYFDGEEDY